MQAAVATRVAGGLDIYKSAERGDVVSVLYHVIADADAVNKRDGESGVLVREYLPAAPLCSSFIFIIFMRQVHSFAFL